MTADPSGAAPAARPTTHTGTRTVLHDPEGVIEAELPPIREPYECLIKAALAWTGPHTLAERDYEQIALQLTAQARALAADVHRHTALLPEESGARALADIVLDEAQRRLSVPIEGTVCCAQNRARLVRALYERLERLKAANPVRV
ncbi:restriction endonuclease [Streptomyces sp. NPDC016469]|uniref:restriction endonuclease n=1 Tax=Streptomyces sp. NPDC016469 TaxID=3157191 RepID=UPI0033C5D887